MRGYTALHCAVAKGRTVDGLPNELWEWEILSQLDKADLASTALVNRRLNAQVNALRNWRRQQQALKE